MKGLSGLLQVEHSPSRRAQGETSQARAFSSPARLSQPALWSEHSSKQGSLGAVTHTTPARVTMTSYFPIKHGGTLFPQAPPLRLLLPSPEPQEFSFCPP